MMFVTAIALALDEMRRRGKPPVRIYLEYPVRMMLLMEGGQAYHAGTQPQKTFQGVPISTPIVPGKSYAIDEDGNRFALELRG